MSIKDWNIDGIADEVMKAMHEDNAPIEDADDYVQKIAYWTVYSREPDDADGVAALVKEKVTEKYEDAE
jgi:hypothetical protein